MSRVRNINHIEQDNAKKKTQRPDRAINIFSRPMNKIESPEASAGPNEPLRDKHGGYNGMNLEFELRMVFQAAAHSRVSRFTLREVLNALHSWLIPGESTRESQGGRSAAPKHLDPLQDQYTRQISNVRRLWPAHPALDKELDRLLTFKSVKEELMRTKPNTTDQELDDMSNMVSNTAQGGGSYRKVFAILVILGRPHDIRDFNLPKYSDEALPLPSRSLKALKMHREFDFTMRKKGYHVDTPNEIPPSHLLPQEKSLFTDLLMFQRRAENLCFINCDYAGALEMLDSIYQQSVVYILLEWLNPILMLFKPLARELVRFWNPEAEIVPWRRKGRVRYHLQMIRRGFFRKIVPLLFEYRSGDTHMKNDLDAQIRTWIKKTSRFQVFRPSFIRYSRFDRVRLHVESCLGQRLNWAPLPPIRDRLSQGGELSWEYGGRRMSIYVDYDQCPTCYRNFHGVELQWGLPELQLELPGPGPDPAPRALFEFKGPIRRLFRTLLAATLFRGRESQSESLTEMTSPASSAASGKEFYVSLGHRWTNTGQTWLYTIPLTTELNDDYELFKHMNQTLMAGHGNRAAQTFSWTSHTKVYLTKFTFLFDNSDLVSTLASLENIEPEELCRGYAFTLFPTVRDFKTHMKIMGEIILHGLRDPECGRGTRTVLDGVPKLQSPPGLLKGQLKTGWGFHADVGLCLKKILCWIIVILVLSIAFIPTWLVFVNATDLQNALAPGTFLAALVAIALAIAVIS